jgi:hypothetical protein
MLTKDELPACPVATMVELIGNKWKLLIIRNLLANTSRVDFAPARPSAWINKATFTEARPLNIY